MSATSVRTRVSASSAPASPGLGAKKLAASARPSPNHTLCAFTFANGHRCRMPRRQDHACLCFFHARKEAQSLAAENAGEEIAGFLSGAYVSACDLNSALARLFVAVAQGHIKPKTASTLAYLGQTLVQALHLAQHEYINAFGTDSWRRTVRSSFAPPAPPSPPAANLPAQPASPPPVAQASACAPVNPTQPGPSTANSGSPPSASPTGGSTPPPAHPGTAGLQTGQPQPLSLR